MRPKCLLKLFFCKYFVTLGLIRGCCYPSVACSMVVAPEASGSPTLQNLFRNSKPKPPACFSFNTCGLFKLRNIEWVLKEFQEYRVPVGSRSFSPGNKGKQVSAEPTLLWPFLTCTLNEGRKRKFGSKHCSGEAGERGCYSRPCRRPITGQVGSDQRQETGHSKASTATSCARPSIFNQATLSFFLGSESSVGAAGRGWTSRAGNSLGGTSFFHCCRKRKKAQQVRVGFPVKSTDGSAHIRRLGTEVSLRLILRDPRTDLTQVKDPPVSPPPNTRQMAAEL